MNRATAEIQKGIGIILRQGALTRRIYVLVLYLQANPAITSQVNDNYPATALSYCSGSAGGEA